MQMWPLIAVCISIREDECITVIKGHKQFLWYSIVLKAYASQDL
jgi:hypothetical protein